MILLYAVYCFPVTYLFYNCCPYVLILYTYITYSPISHLWQPLVFPLYLFCYIFPVFFFHIFYIWIKTYNILSFSVWFILFCIMSSRFIYLVANGKISFFRMAELYSVVRVSQFLYPLIYWWTLPYLDCVSYATINTGVHASFQIRAVVFSSYMFSGSYNNSIFSIFLKQLP